MVEWDTVLPPPIIFIVGSEMLMPKNTIFSRCHFPVGIMSASRMTVKPKSFHLQ
jgi:hypothetical protein